MTDDKRTPAKVNSSEVAAFLQQASKTPMRAAHHELAAAAARKPGRLLFAMDATASRQPSWDRACHLQARMFAAVAKIGRLNVQLCYYRGLAEFQATPWFDDPQQLTRIMSRVFCEGGYTQLYRVLQQAIAETRQQRVQAVVVVSDAVEEDIDDLFRMAGELALLQTPLFMFQEGNDPDVAEVYRKMAQLSGGAYCPFDEGSSDQLGELLGAVAVFASGGRDSLRKLLANARPDHPLLALTKSP